jgi:hypothetical protein
VESLCLPFIFIMLDLRYILVTLDWSITWFMTLLSFASNSQWYCDIMKQLFILHVLSKPTQIDVCPKSHRSNYSLKMKMLRLIIVYKMCCFNPWNYCMTTNHIEAKTIWLFLLQLKLMGIEITLNKLMQFILWSTKLTLCPLCVATPHLASHMRSGSCSCKMWYHTHIFRKIMWQTKCITTL